MKVDISHIPLSEHSKNSSWSSNQQTLFRKHTCPKPFQPEEHQDILF